jgi:hypothetical protein
LFTVAGRRKDLRTAHNVALQFGPLLLSSPSLLTPGRSPYSKTSGEAAAGRFHSSSQLSHSQEQDQSYAGCMSANPAELDAEIGLGSRSGGAGFRPLSQSHVAALAALFGWQVPDGEQAVGGDELWVGPASLEA